MSEIKVVVGRGIPLQGDDIDTDRIIPARFLRCVTFDGLGEQVFADDRSQMKGEHPFDLPQYQGAKILVVNNNFGCGSSREHAPQAIIRWGIDAIIGESFAEIFLGNSLTNGVPCVTATPEAIALLQQLLQSQPETILNLDLSALTVKGGGLEIAIAMAEGDRQSLVSGKWDSFGQLVQNLGAIQEKSTQIPYLHGFPIS
jgi:3-isopropylmalate/(R)-2-methylmalate dehydratase small subunit